MTAGYMHGFIPFKTELQFIVEILKKSGVIYGFAYLGDNEPKFRKLRYAISIAVKLRNSVVERVAENLGPTPEYCDEYRNANRMLDRIAKEIEIEIKDRGYDARTIPASKRTDLAGMRGEFPHKTAATKAGLGWIGKSSLLVTRESGPRVRLVTVLTNLPLKQAEPVKKSYCGECRECVTACPVGAISGKNWYPGIQREELVDVFRCEEWKKSNYFDICDGRVCGICMAVCPFGRSNPTF